MLTDALMDGPDFEWLMTDANYVKAHPHGTGTQGGNQSIVPTKGS